MWKRLEDALAVATVAAAMMLLPVVGCGADADAGGDASGESAAAATAAGEGAGSDMAPAGEFAPTGDAEADYASLMAELQQLGQQVGAARSQQEALGLLADIEKGLVGFREAYPGTPEAADAAFQLGTLKVSMGQLTQVSSHYMEAATYLAAYIIDAPPETPRANLAHAHYYLAEAYKATGKWEEAKREYDIVVNQYGSVNPRMTEFARSNLQDIEVQKKLAIGEEPLHFEVTSISGEKLSPAKYKGKVLLIDFWATWCRPCLAEMPHVQEVYRKYNEKGFEIVGISLDRNRSSLDSYLESNKIPWPQYFDGKYWNNDIVQQYGVRSIPATFLIDREGKIRYKSLRGKQLEMAVEKLLDEES